MTNDQQNNEGSLIVDVVSDIVCPWCFVGKRHLDIAVEAMPEINFDIRWRPFQLNPQMPKEGMDRKGYMEKKFGKGEPTTNFYKQLEDIGEELDINFQFEAIKFAPNTLNAHRLIHWASGGTEDGNGGSKNGAAQQETGIHSHQTQLVTRLFEVYFKEGGNLGDDKVLAKAAQSQGMNEELVAELLASERDVDAISEQVSVAGNMGISGVPCFIIENKYAVMGAQKPEALIEAFKSAHDEKMQNSG